MTGRTAKPRRAALPIAFLLSLLAVTVCFPITGYDFLKWEDSAYIAGNPVVSGGLGVTELKGALTTAPEANWMPLTWIMMAAQADLSGASAPQAFPFRLTSLILHALAGLLLWMLLGKRFSAWVAFAAAAAFLIHPQRVESVAWISSQKDLLATLFLLAAALSYHRTFQSPGSTRWRVISALFFTASLLSKPAAVSAPLIILLIEAMQGAAWRDSLRRAAPFFAIALIVSVICWRMNTSGEMLFDPSSITFLQRIAQPFAVVSHHLFTFFFPFSNIPEIALPDPLWPWVSCGAVIVLSILAAMRFAALREIAAPALAWLILLLPVSGLIPLPMAFTSDRMNHLPSLALSFALAGLLHRQTARYHRTILLTSIPVSLILLASWAGITRQQSRYWKDDQTLFRHILSIHPRHAVAHVNLGVLALAENDTATALRRFRDASRGDRPLFSAWNNLLILQIREKDNPAAITTARSLCQAFPKRAESWFLLGTAHQENQDPRAALEAFRKADSLRPDSLMILTALSDSLTRLGRQQEASEIRSRIPAHLRR